MRSSMPGRWMIYGATGYTGRLVVQEAIRRGLAPVLAGRNASRLADLARPPGLEAPLEIRVAPLEDPGALVRALDGIQVVLNAAGPFSSTAAPLAAACLAARVHYLDLTGEIPVFQALHRLDGAARDRGILLLPGAGFIVIPSDCLAAHVARRLPGARWLRLGISRSTLVSRGSARTMMELLEGGAHIRRESRLDTLSWDRLDRKIDFGEGPRPALVVSWADVFTAYHTTGIPNIEACLEVGPWERLSFRLSFQNSRRFAWLLRTPPWRMALENQLAFLPEGPSAADRARDRRVLVAVAGDASGRTVISRLRTPEAYTFTAVAAVECVRRVLEGEGKSGFQTPAGLFGADFVLGLAGVERVDVAV